MKIIDFHVHAFPDAVAERAVPLLEKEGDVKAALDGKIGSLLRSMDEAGVAASVVSSIATKPAQFDGIMAWMRAIASERLIPFASVHPADPLAVERIGEIAAAGFKGVKLHPYYQQFSLEEERAFALFETIQEKGLILLCHCGFDLAYPRDRVCDPEKTLRVVEAFPRLRFIASHMGAWEDWDEAEKHLLGKPIYMDVSYSLDQMGADRARRFLLDHPADYLLFGTDSPWFGQREGIELVRSFDLGEERERKLLGENAATLLGL